MSLRTCYSIKSKDVKKMCEKILCGRSDPKHFLKKNVSQKSKIYENVKLDPSILTKIKTPSQVPSKDFAKILIYLSVYISLNSGKVASKIFDKS